MYRIGQFSRFTKVTVKALRFYEEEKLLEPCYVDPVNGYRYYNSEQLPTAHKIVALRQCGFSIPEIRRILCGRDIAKLFAERKKELEAHATETALQLSSINHYLAHIGKEEQLKYEIVIKELPCVIVYSKRMVVESYDSYFTEIPKIGEEVIATNPGLRCLEDPPYCFIIYHDGEYRDHDIDVEYCEAVTQMGKDTKSIKFKTMDRVAEAACVMHQGPYSLLWKAYQAVFKWIEDNNLLPSDCPRESYIDGIWNKGDDEEQWLTEVQVPVLRS
jgi:DNA-binding transcriptional MerR regulator